MLQTEHYQLNQWDLEDRVLMADFNNDNTKIETALHGLAEETAGKADSGTVNALAAEVAQKAEQSALAAEQAARENADNAEQAARIAADSAEKAAREAADAALDKRAGAQLIHMKTLTESNAYFILSLQDISWADWREVHLLFQPGAYTGTCNLQFNGFSAATLGNTASGPWHIILYPCFTPALTAAGFAHPCTRESAAFSFGLTYESLEFLQISANTGVFQPDASVTIWGVK